MSTQRLTMAQALVKHLAALRIERELPNGTCVIEPYCGGVFTIFGHGNVAGFGEALAEEAPRLRTFRAHNEQSMAHAAIAYSKSLFRQRILAVSTSIGPGATNMVTAAAVAHVNRLPVLLLPGDTFSTRRPDPVLQQIENFSQGDTSANDCFRPVTRYFDRLTRPEQVLTALPRAIQMMTDPAACGPACLSLPQDVQAMAFDCPDEFLTPNLIRIRRPSADQRQLHDAAVVLRSAKRPLLVVGGGVLYSQAWDAIRAFAEEHGVPVVETHGGKSSLPWNHPLNVGAIGVDGVSTANDMASQADVVFAVGTRLQDFTTGSHALFAQAKLLSLNVQPYDAGKWGSLALVGDARSGLEQLQTHLLGWSADPAWTARAKQCAVASNAAITALTRNVPTETLPYDAEVIGAVRDSCEAMGLDSAYHDVAVCAAGTLPAELHKLWRANAPGNYHVEYGYSCMGYEIAGGLGVKMARPDQEVIVFVGDGSYMMANSEIATSVLLGHKLIIVVLDNRGYGCIQRLQTASGSAAFNNLLDDCVGEQGEASTIDFAMHARAMGADAVHVPHVSALKAAMVNARQASRTQVIVIDTTHTRTTDGGCWWEVAIPEVSQREAVREAHARYVRDQSQQRV
jgi:3D-(3,5/4)-trihydroxycyclohexane-1,2-dione acylhydrolase (decyclizing)